MGGSEYNTCTQFVGALHVTCTQFVGALHVYEKLDPTSLNEVSYAKAATKVLSTDNSFHLHILPAHPTT